MKTRVAIVGSGNIGTDLMIKILETSDTLEMGALVGIDPESDGLARARKKGVATTHEGLEGLTRMPEWADIEIVFDATSAGAHAANAAICLEHGKTIVDLTPAAIGPYVVPVVNMDEHLDAPNINMVSCGGQATIPIVHAVDRVARVHYGEIVASISSKSAGPGTRANIDEFTETTSKGIEVVGGAERGKAIIVLNPAEPPLLMRDTIYVLSEDGDTDAIVKSIEDMVAEVQAYVPGYRLKQDVQFETFRLQQPAPHPRARGVHRNQVLDLPRSRGGGALSADLCRQSRHHDFGRAQDRRTAGRAPRFLRRTAMALDTEKKIYIQDVTLRDGMHAIRHQYGLHHVTAICKALDEAKVDAIEVSHGDGLAGMSFNYGFAAHSDIEYIEVAADAVEHAKIADPADPGHRHRPPTSRTPSTRARGRSASRPIAPRPTSPSSTSNTPAGSAWMSRAS